MISKCLGSLNHKFTAISCSMACNLSLSELNRMYLNTDKCSFMTYTCKVNYIIAIFRRNDIILEMKTARIFHNNGNLFCSFESFVLYLFNILFRKHVIICSNNNCIDQNKSGMLLFLMIYLVARNCITL